MVETSTFDRTSNVWADADGRAHPRRASLSERLHELEGFLATEDGRRLRHAVALSLLILAPWLPRILFLRSPRIARFVGTAVAAPLIVKAAHRLREWDPQRGPVLTSP